METVNVLSRTHTVAELRQSLEKLLPSRAVKIQEKSLHVTGYDGFSVEPATLVVSGAGVLSALINALLTYMKEKTSGTITIEGRTGRKIVIPRGTKPEDVERYVKMAQQLD